MLFMGERKLVNFSSLPDEHNLYMLCLRTGKLPYEIRAMDLDDLHWLQIYYSADKLARDELKNRIP